MHSFCQDMVNGWDGHGDNLMMGGDMSGTGWTWAGSAGDSE